MARELRRLAAIVSADVVGYSRLMGRDETGTLSALRAHQAELIDPAVTEYGGRIVKTMGDGLLLEFASVVAATRFAIAVQGGMADRNAGIPGEDQIVFRIGINLGDVIIEGDDIFGDGVNVAARLQEAAEAGGVVISQTVYNSVAGKLDTNFVDNGEHELKNIAAPVQLWSWPNRLAETRRSSKPLVLVATFKGRSDEEGELAEGIRDELTAALARLTGLEVTVDETKAHYVVRGTVRLAGQRCRISAQLIGDDSEKQLWADRFDEEASDPFALQDRCATRISMSVRRTIAADDANRIAGQDLDQLSLEELMSVAGVSFFTPTMAGWRGGGEIAERALERDPRNFMALAMAATGLGMAEILYGYRESDEAELDTAFRRIEEAQRLTDKSDMSAVVYSGLLLYGRGRHAEARAAAERSLQLNTDYNMGLWALGASDVFAGDYETGAEHAVRAVDVHIRDPYVHLYSRIAGYGFFGAARYRDAVEWFLRADQSAPSLPHNLLGLAASYWLDGDQDGAHAAIDRLLDAEPSFKIADLARLPFRDVAVWERFIGALNAAGAPA